MQSKTSFFSTTIFRRNLSSSAPLWILYSLLWTLLIPISILTTNDPSASYYQYNFYQLALDGGSIVNFVYAILIAMVFFSWQYNTRSVNTLSALPIRREAYFITNVLSALTISVIPNLLVTLSGILAYGISEQFFAIVLMQSFLIVTLQFIFFFGVAVLCAAIVGQLIALPLLYMVFNFGAYILRLVLVDIVSTFVYGMDGNILLNMELFSPILSVYPELSPQFYDEAVYSFVAPGMHVEEIGQYTFNTWTPLVVLALVGILLGAVAFLLFRRRRMEAAGDMIAVRPLRPVFKYSFALGCSLFLGDLMATLIFDNLRSESLPVLVVCMLISGFIGYFGAEILLKKSFRVFRREWLGFGIFSACILVGIGAMSFDLFGYEARVPQMDDIASVSVASYRYSSATLEDPAYIADAVTLHQGLIAAKQEQQQLAQSYHYVAFSGDSTRIQFKYTLKDGSSFTRMYSYYCTEEMWQDADNLGRRFATLLNDPRMLVAENVPDFPVALDNVNTCELEYRSDDSGWIHSSLSVEDSFELYSTCILPDLQDGLIGLSYPLFSWTESKDYDASISMEFVADRSLPQEKRNYAYLGLQITEGSRTAEWVEAYTNQELVKISER